jgi:uncharacterized membrane protein YgaE (UPF0421/DUF939 family)
MLSTRLPPPPRPSRAELQLVAKMILAGTLAWWLCTLLGQPRPLFAVLVPLVAMDGDPFASVNVSLTRTIGVFAGVLLGLALYGVHLTSTALVTLLLALSLAAGLLLRAPTGPVNNQVAITAMFMLYLGAVDRAEAVGIARIWETAIGAVFAVGVAVTVWPPHPLAEARRRVTRLRAWLAEDLRRAAALVRRPDEEEAEQELDLVRDRSLRAVRDVFQLERAERALRWNPRSRTDRQAFAVERDRLNGAARQYRHLRTIARIVADTAEAAPLPAGDCERLASMIETLAAAADDSVVIPPPVDVADLSDPRAVALAVKLEQMVDDLAA